MSCAGCWPADGSAPAGWSTPRRNLLRGQRGKVVRNRAKDRLVDIAPVRGQDVHLTIDLALQKWIYVQLGQAVHDCPTASGASAVVLDVNTREVLAAVSWPGYTLEEFSQHYEKLARDGVHQKLRCRAIANSYAPGSIVKPVTIMAALNSGLVSPDERINCTGALDPNNRKSFRCWATAGHGPLNAQEAIMHSCDVFLYVMGRRLGVQREAEWFNLFGLGRAAGTDLLEEANGKVPGPDEYKPYELQGASQNLAIGQGELLLTPLQAANLGATIATGFWQPVTLLAEQADRSRAARRIVPGTAGSWRIIRDGMSDVVNEAAGTAHKFARSRDPNLTIAGKTGTAETGPRVTSYIYDLQMHDGSTRTMEFPSRSQAADTITQMGESVVKWDLKGARYWPAPPDPEHKPTHSWFMGYAPARSPKVAVAVQIEYGGSGSHVAGPVARDIIDYVFGVEGGRRGVRGEGLSNSRRQKSGDRRTARASDLGYMDPDTADSLLSDGEEVGWQNNNGGFNAETQRALRIQGRSQDGPISGRRLCVHRTGCRCRSDLHACKQRTHGTPAVCWFRAVVPAGGTWSCRQTTGGRAMPPGPKTAV